jgi:hypothetical protein
MIRFFEDEKLVVTGGMKGIRIRIKIKIKRDYTKR